MSIETLIFIDFINFINFLFFLIIYIINANIIWLFPQACLKFLISYDPYNMVLFMKNKNFYSLKIMIPYLLIGLFFNNNHCSFFYFEQIDYLFSFEFKTTNKLKIDYTKNSQVTSTKLIFLLDLLFVIMGICDWTNSIITKIIMFFFFISLYLTSIYESNNEGRMINFNVGETDKGKRMQIAYYDKSTIEHFSYKLNLALGVISE